MKHIAILKLVSGAVLAALLSQSGLPPAYAGVAVGTGQNFTGSISSQHYAFANPSGAAGTDYFVEFSQENFAVYSKADGSVVQAMDGPSFWTRAGLSLSTTTAAYPRVVFDPAVQRWFAAEIVPPYLRLAVSETADPSGPWHGVTLPDRPGSTSIYHFAEVYLGLDAQGVYLSSVVWPVTNAYVPIGTAVWSFPKSDLLSIPPDIANRTWFGLLFATNYGYGLDPAIALDGSTGGNVLATGSDGVDAITDNPQTDTNLIALAFANVAGPGPATLGATQAMLVPPYTGPVNYALQPDGLTNLAEGGAKFTASVYRVGGALFAAHPLQYGPRVAVQWFRLSATNHALLESGIITDPNLDLYFPSIAANTNGTVVLAFNGSGSNVFVSCYAVVGQTIHGATSFGNLLLLRAGTATYFNPVNGYTISDWGAYSTICVDPTDPNIFWTINAYAAGPTTWATQITQLLTSPSPQLSITTAGGGVQLAWPVTDVPFQLQSASGLTDPGGWSPVALAPATNGATVSVLLPMTNTSAFFRLVQSQ